MMISETEKDNSSCCFHVVRVLTCHPPIIVERCCHCGLERERRQDDNSGHGPFLFAKSIYEKESF